MSPRSENLSDTQQVAIGINDSKLPQPPWLVLEGIHARNACAGELCQSKIAVNALNIRHPDVAHRRRFSGLKLAVSEEVKLHRPSREDGVVTVTMDLSLETQSLKKGQRVTQGPSRQNRNGYVLLLHNVRDVGAA